MGLEPGTININTNDNNNRIVESISPSGSSLFPGSPNDNLINKNAAHFRYRRSRSVQACQTCNKRKVRCDVTTKNYPEQKCTNCEEFGVDCILVQRRKKRTKAQIEADRLEELRQQELQSQENNDLKVVGESNQISEPLSSASIPTITKKRKRKPPVQEQQQEQEQEQEQQQQQQQQPKQKQKQKQKQIQEQHININNPIYNQGEIQMDVAKVLSRKVDQFKLSQFIKVLTSHYGLKLTMHDYYKFKGTITIGDLITPQCTNILKLAGCFILPTEEKSKKYINAYFENFQTIYPCLSRTVFDQEYKNLSNPASLLLLRSILYIGCRMYAKTKEEHEESALLYERARLILNADMEPDAVSLVLSTFILSTPPSPHLSLITIEDGLSVAIKLAITFGMHKDADNVSYLTPHEKRSYKRLFWILILADRAYALSFAKNYNFDASVCTVKEMTQEDFIDLNHPTNPSMFQYTGYSNKFIILMDKVTSLQKKANVAAVKRQPVLGYHRHIDELLKEYYSSLPDYLKDPSLSMISFLSVLYYHSLNIFIQRVNMFRMLSVILKCVQSEKTKPGSSNYITQEQLLINPCLTSLSESAFVLAEALINSVKKYEFHLPCIQNSLFLVFQSAVILLPLPYHTDENIRKKAKEYLPRVVSSLAEVNDAISWQMIDACWFILTEITKDQDKYIRYLRRTVSATNVEELIKDASSYPHLKKLTLSNTLPFVEPIFNLNSTLLAIERESKLNHNHSWDNSAIHSNSSINEVDVKAQEFLMANHKSRTKVKEQSSESELANIPLNTNTTTTSSENESSTSNEDLFVDIPYSSIQELLMVQIGNTKTLEGYKIDFDADIKEHLPNLFDPVKMEDKNKINDLLFPSVSNTQPPLSGPEMYPQHHGNSSSSSSSASSSNNNITDITSFNNLPFVTPHVNRLTVPNLSVPQSIPLPPIRSPSGPTDQTPLKFPYYHNIPYYPPKQ